MPLSWQRHCLPVYNWRRGAIGRASGLRFIGRGGLELSASNLRSRENVILFSLPLPSSLLHLCVYRVGQVSAMDERNAQLDREKAALADLLAAKKSEYDQMRQHYRDRVSDLEDEVQRLKSEKLRLVDKLQLPESERGSLMAQVKHICTFRKQEGRS